SAGVASEGQIGEAVGCQPEALGLFNPGVGALRALVNEHERSIVVVRCPRPVGRVLSPSGRVFRGDRNGDKGVAGQARELTIPFVAKRSPDTGVGGAS